MNLAGQAEVSPEAAEKQIQDLLASVQVPNSVSEVRFELGTDHMGDPAVRIFLVMEPKFQAGFDRETKRREELRKFRADLASKVLKLNSGYFPFIRLPEAS